MSDEVYFPYDDITFAAADFLADGGYGYLGDVVINATTYSRFIALFVAGIRQSQDFVNQCQAKVDLAEGFADDAQASALASAASAAELSGTSTTSLTIGSGTKTLNVGAGKAWVVGMGMRVARTSAPADQWMIGILTAYDSGTGVASMTVDTEEGNDYEATGGTGPYTDWTVSFAGWEGPRGTDGVDSWNTPIEIDNGDSPYSPVSGDILLVDPTDGVDIVTQTNSPTRFSIIPRGVITAEDFIRIAPPTGKSILHQTVDDRVLVRKQIKGISFYKDANGNYR